MEEVPLLICACCGFKIEREKHKIQQGYVCERCWSDPNLFFPEKMDENKNWKNLVEALRNADVRGRNLIVPVIKVRQKEITLYSGKLKAKDILQLYGIYGFRDETLEGYQRELYENKVDDLNEYISCCDIAITPSILISIRNGIDFIPSLEGSDIGIIKVPLQKGSIWIIDGQHRIGAFENVLSKIASFRNQKVQRMSSLSNLMNYEFPVTFLDSLEAARTINHKNGENITPFDIERTIFFVINVTHKRISPSLKDILRYCICEAGVDGIPSIERNRWRSNATLIAIKLNSLESSPLHGKINISGRRGLNRPIRLNSFVSSLKYLYANEDFLLFDSKERLSLLLSYWEVIEDMYKEAFSEETCQDYLVLKAIGIYTLNWLCSDFLLWCKRKALDCFDKKTIIRFLKKINDFDWSKDKSPIAGFGGMKGVKEAHSILLGKIEG